MIRRFMLVAFAAALLVTLLPQGLSATVAGDAIPATQSFSVVTEGVLTVGTDPNYPPFEFKDGDVYKGFDVDLCTEIASRTGLEVKFASYPFGTLIDVLRSGDKIDMIASGLSISPDRAKLIGFSAPYFTAGPGDQYGFGFKKSNTALRDAVNGALAKMKADGTYGKIYDKYTALSFSAPATCPYRSAKVYGYLRYTGTLGGSLKPLVGKNVYIQHYKAGAWKTVAKVVTSSTGRYSYTLKPTTKTTYRALYYGNSAHLRRTSAKRYVLPKIYFSSAPKSSTYTHTYGKTYSVWGYIKPEHTTGSHQIKLKAYRKTKQADGTYKYVWKRTYATTISNPSGSSYSKYSGSVKLPSKGKWRLRAYHAADSKNAKSYSSYRYVTVE